MLPAQEGGTLGHHKGCTRKILGIEHKRDTQKANNFRVKKSEKKIFFPDEQAFNGIIIN